MLDEAEPTDADVDAVLHEFKGDTRQAVHALLHDLWLLAADYAVAVSLGYVRRRISAGAERVMARRQSTSD